MTHEVATSTETCAMTVHLSIGKTTAKSFCFHFLERSVKTVALERLLTMSRKHYYTPVTQNTFLPVNGPGILPYGIIETHLHAEQLFRCSVVPARGF